MKMKEGFMLREIAGIFIVTPIGERVMNFNGLISLNETGAFLWNELNKCCDAEHATARLLDEYETDEKTARKDVLDFIELLKSEQIIEQ